MSRHYLNVPFKQKDAVKALGGRWDVAAKRWYIDRDGDLTEFKEWLPAEGDTQSVQRELSVAPSSASTLTTATPKAVTLSQLLNGVGSAVAEAFRAGVWTLVEVVQVRARGHVYLELAERDGSGQQIAKAGAMIWSATATKILPDFESATGAVLGPGIKLLVRARPVFKANYGFSLEIDAIDPQYTLGDLEARKKEIRDRLQREGVFDSNRRLPAPFDYLTILVVAPEEGAGLGDFQKEAERLEQHGICRFVYVHSRFQGEGAAREIVAAMSAALDRFHKDARPDAIVLIRGGGAVNDLAWLNDYDLARFICDQQVPVLTGIGHERDTTLPDEVAHTRFDTPSKVIAGIEQQILQRVRETRAAADRIFASAAQATARVRNNVDRIDAQVRADARSHVSRAREGIGQALSNIKITSTERLHEAAAGARTLSHQVQTDSTRHLAAAKQRVPALLSDVRMAAVQRVSQADRSVEASLSAVLARGQARADAASRSIETSMAALAERAHGSVQTARAGTEALMREVTGQGPDKTLARGFAIVRGPSGEAVTSTAQASQLGSVDIQFHDGMTRARPEGKT